MAKSKFEYVKVFENEDRCLPNCWIVVRLDGKGFHRFSELHGFCKPNDKRSLNVMTAAAKTVMKEFRDIVISYGQSDEFSFVFRKSTNLYNRRSSKLMSNTCSLFSSSYVYHWREHFPDVELTYPPSFDGRVVLYPTDQNLRDYLSWRQADCHINNLYNTVFWALVQKGGMTTTQAEDRLKGSLSADKNEILFQFGINYNDEPEVYKKGTILLYTVDCSENIVDSGDKKHKKAKPKLESLHTDLIREDFWRGNPDLLH